MQSSGPETELLPPVTAGCKSAQCDLLAGKFSAGAYSNNLLRKKELQTLPCREGRPSCSKPRAPHPSIYIVAQSCLTLCDPTDCSPPGSSVHGDSPGKNTGVGCHAFLQGIWRRTIQGVPGRPLGQGEQFQDSKEFFCRNPN